MHKYAIIVTYMLLGDQPPDCNHSICVLRTDESLEGLYSMVNKFLSERYAVIYAIDPSDIGVPKDQLVDHVIMKLKSSGTIENVGNYIRTGALRIMDVHEIYLSDLAGDAAFMLKKLTSIFNDIKKKKFKNIAIIAGGPPFLLDSDSQDKLIDYEQTILKAAEKKSVHIICCYLQESLDEVQFAQLAAIVSAHQCNVIPVRAGMQSRRIFSSLLLDAIVDGIESVMGKGSGRLVMRTMEMVYKINEEIIISNPSLFQEKLQKILGNSSKTVLTSVNNRIKEILLLVSIIAATHYTLYSTTLSLL